MDIYSHLEEWLFHVGTQTYAKSMEVGNRNRATEYVKGDGLDFVILAFRNTFHFYCDFVFGFFLFPSFLSDLRIHSFMFSQFSSWTTSRRLQTMIEAETLGAVIVANFSCLSRQFLGIEIFRLRAALHNTLLYTDARFSKRGRLGVKGFYAPRAGVRQ